MHKIKKKTRKMRVNPRDSKKFFWVLLVFVLIIGIWIGVQGANQGMLTLATSAQGLTNQDGAIKVRIRALDASKVNESLYTIDQTAVVKDGQLKLRWQIPGTAKKKAAYIEVCALDKRAGPSSTVKKACIEQGGDVSYNKVSCPYYVPANSTGFSGQLNGWNKLDDSQKVGCSDGRSFSKVSSIKALAAAQSPGIEIDGGGVLVANNGKIQTKDVEQFVKDALSEVGGSAVHITTNVPVPGPQGAAGANGTNGTNGADGAVGIATVSGGGLILTGSNLSLDDSCLGGQILQWDGSSWNCASVSGTDSQTLSLVANVLAISGGNSVNLSGYLDNTDSQALSWVSGTRTLSLTGGGSVVISDSDTTYSAGNGLSLGGTTFSINSPTCAGTTKLTWNGTAFSCAVDVDTDTNTTYSAGTGLNLSGTTFNVANTAVTAGSYAPSNNANGSLALPQFTVDAQGRMTAASTTNVTLTGIANSQLANSAITVNTAGPLAGGGSVSLGGSLNLSLDLSDAGDSATATTSSGSGLEVSGNEIGLIRGCSSNQLLKWNSGSLRWECASDTDTNSGGTVTSITAGTGLSGGTITTSGTINIASTGVTAASYGSSTSIPVITVNAQGQITAASSAAIPTASTSTTGLLTSTDWNTFNGKENVLTFTGNGLFSRSGNTVTGLACSVGQIPKWTAGAFACGTDIDTDTNTTYSAGNGLSLGGTTFSINSPTCAGTTKLTWNGTAFSCATDVDTDTDTTNFNVAANGGAGQNISSGGTVNFTNGTGTTASRSGSDISFGLANTAVTAGTYAPSNNANGSLALPQLTVDAQGRLTAASTTNVTLTGIANSQLANSAITVNTTGPITGGGSVSLGGSLSLNFDLSDSGDSATATTNSGSGLEVSGGEVGLIRGCSSNQLLKWNSSSLRWECAADVDTDTNSGGTVTSITAGTGLSGGTITTSGTINIASTGVTAASYGSSTSIPVITVNAQGQITAASSTSIPTANTSTTGLLTSTDWNTFNGKENVLTFNGNGLFSRSGNTVTGLACSAGEIPKWTAGAFACGTDSGGTSYLAGNGLSLGGSTFSINSPTCAGTDKLQWTGTAFLCSADVDTDTDTTNFNVAAAGTVGSQNISSGGTVTFGNGTGTTATRSGSTVTYGLNNTAVSAGSYAPSDNANGSLALPQFTVDAQGRLTAASTTNVTLTGIANSQLTNSAITVNASGPLSTTSSTISLGGSATISLNLNAAGDANSATTSSGSGLEVSGSKLGLIRGCATGELLKYNSTSKQWACAADIDTDTNSGGTVTSITAGTGLSGGTITTSGTIDIANTGVTAATYGSSTSIPVIAVNAQGQITSASSTAIPTANTSTTGLLTSTDWNTFNGKENVLTFTGNGLFSRSGNTITGLACTGSQIAKWNVSAFACGADNDTTYSAGNGLSLGGTTFSINSPTCAGTDKLTWSGTAFSCATDVDTDTTNFNVAAQGTVGSQNISSGNTVTFNNGTGTTATRSGSTVTYGLNNTAVTAGAYAPSDNANGSLALPQFTVDAQGRLTAASTTNVTLTGIANSQLANSAITVNTTGPITGGGSVSLGGSLSLNFDLSDAGDANTATTSSGSGLEVSSGEIGLLRGCNTGELLKYNTTSKQWACASDTDTNSGGTVTSITAGTGLSGGTITTSGTIDIANTGVTAATYGSSTSIPVIAVNAQGQITSASSTAIPTASTSTTGLLTSTDWNTFNGKENVLTFNGNGLFSRSGNTVTGLSCIAGEIPKWSGSAFACGADAGGASYVAGNGLSLSGSTFSINSPTCAGTDKLTWSGTAFSCATDVDTDTDTTNFNVAAAGTVGSQNISSGGTVTFGNGTGTTATRSGSTVTYGLNNTAVTAGTYTPADNADGSLALPQFTVDAQGRLTAASTTNVTLTGIDNSQLANSSITVSTAGGLTGATTVSLGGTLSLGLDLSDAGDANTATTSSGSGLEVSSGEIGLLRGCSTGELLKYNTTSKQWSCATDTDTNSGGTVTSITAGTGLSGGTITTSGTIDIANTGVTAATYGSSTSIPVIAVNAQGQITSATSTAIPTANTSTTGLLTSTDWNTFNGKENVLTFTGNGLFSRSGNTITGLACTGSQIAKWNAGAFACGADNDTTYSAGNGLSLSSTTFSINSPTCSGTDKLQWTGTVFVCSADVDTDTGVTSIGTIDSQTKSANGAVISGTSLVLQTADGSNPGLVSTTTQTFAGAKTFSGNVNANGDVTLGDAAADGITITGEIRGASPLAFEGLTNDGVYTTLAITDPTVARTITFPDRSGTVSLSGDTFTGDVTGTLNASGATALTIAANSVALGTDTTGDYVAGNTAGNGISVSGSAGEGWSPTISINAPTCAGTDKLTWNGSAFSCATDVDTDTTNFNVAASGTVGSQNISSGGTVTFNAGTGTTATRSGSTVTYGLANTAVSAGTYSPSDNANGSLALPQFTVDAQGRLTAASTTNVTLTGIANSQLTNSAITVNTTGPITGGGSVSLGGSLTLNFDLSDAGDANTATTSSGSGLEVSGGEIGLLRGCSTGELLKYNTTSKQWACSSDIDTNSGGTVTSITAGTGLNGGTITTSGTIDIANTGVTAATYGSSTSIPVIAVNAQGQITSASSTAIPTASTSTTGLLTSTDWNTFNGKENVLTFTGNGLFSRSGNTITGLACTGSQIAKWSVSAFACGTDNDTTYTAGNGLSLGGTTFSINSPTCSGTTKLQWTGTAFLCSTDVDTDTDTTNFNISANGGAGQNIASGNTVNFVNGTGTTASRSTNDISFSLNNTAVSAGTYSPSDNANGSLALPQFTVDAQGRLTAASTTNVTLTGIANSQLANSGITVNTAGGLSGGASVSLGGTLNLSIDLSDAGDANSATTSSGSGLEAVSGEIGLLRGCATNELLKYNSTTKLWACAADVDTNSGGTVTSITAGTGLNGGTITTSGTIDIANTGVTAATYGSSTSIPVIAVNAQGQITAASSTSIPTANTSTTGLLTSTDWNTFNGKENVLTFTGNGLFSRSGNTVTGLACSTGEIPKWTGTFTCGTDIDTGVVTIGTLDSLTKSANGAVISGTTLVLQTADTTNPGLVSIYGQSFAGAKTFVDDTTIFSTYDSQTAFQVQNSASALLFNVDAYSGSTTIASPGNSTTALQVLNGSGDQLFNVDTSNIVNNLITNPSFEVNDTGWSSSAFGAVDSTQAYVGKSSLNVDAQNAGDGATYDVALASDTTYNLSFYAKVGATGYQSSFTNMYAGYFDGTSNVDCLTGQTVSSSGWTRYSCTFTTGTTSGTPNIYIRQNDSIQRAIYIDGVQLLNNSLSSNVITGTSSTFESGVGSWGGYSSGAVTQSSTTAHMGTYSGRLVTTGGGNENGISYNYSGFSPSTTYTIKAYIKADAASASAIYQLGHVTDNGQVTTASEGCNRVTPTSSMWKVLTCTFTTASVLRSSPYITITQKSNLSTATTTYVDSISMYAGADVGGTDQGFTMGNISLNGAISSPALFQNTSNSTTAFQIQGANSSTSLLVADTLNNRIAIGKALASYTLDVEGVINATESVRTPLVTSTAGLTVTGGTTLTLQSTGANAVSLDSGTTGAINIGTGSSAKTITIGNSTGATSLVLNSGTGAINIGTNAVAHTITLGNSTGTTALTLDAGTGAINIGTNAVAHTVTIGTTTGTGAVVINSGTGNSQFAANATDHTTTIGSVTGTSNTNIRSGTGGITLISAGSASGNVYIGNGSASATPDSLVLDNKNTSGDPTGTVGAMYYNSNANKFRCYQNSAWADCITVDTGVTSIGTLDSLTKSSNGAVISGTTLVMQTADATMPGLVSTGTQTFAGDKTFTGNLTATGTATFQNASNSTGAFRVNNAAGDNLIKFDTATTENLLTNGNFESSYSPWVGKSGSETVSQTGSQYYLGTGSMSVATTAAANDGAKYNYSLASQTAYTMTFYVKNASTTSSTTTVNIGRSEDGSTDKDCATSQSINGGGWSKITCTFTTGNVTGTDYIYIKQTDATARTIYVDSVQLQTSTNLASNPDVEVNNSGWGNYGAITLTQTTSQAYTGSGSLQAVTSASNSSEGPTLTPSVQPNTTYTFSAWVQLDAGTGSNKSFSVLKRFDNIDSASGTSCTSASLVPGTWTNLTCTFTTGNVASSSPFISINVTDDGVTPITFYVDNASLSATKWNSNDIGRISLNGAIDSPLTIRGAQDSTSALQVQQQNGTNVLTVDTLNGRVGIGTAAPNKSLEVDGKALIRATNSDTDTFQVTNTAAVGTANSVIFNVAGNSRAVSVGISSNTTNSSLSVYGTQLINTKSNNANAFRITDNSNTSVLTFATTDFNKRLTIGSSGSGKDGKFSLVGSSGTSMVDFDASGNGSSQFYNDYFNVFTSVGSQLYLDTNVFNLTGTSGTGASLNYDFTTDKLSLGTTVSPSYTLDVGGDINVASGSVYRYNGTAGATTTCSGGQFLQNQVASGGLTTSGTCANAVTTIGSLGGSIANGASISGNTLTLGSADASNPGLVTTGTQTFAGGKTFSGAMTVNNTETIKTNSTTAFRVQNSAGTNTSLLVDATNQTVRFGNGVGTFAHFSALQTTDIYADGSFNLLTSSGNTLYFDPTNFTVSGVNTSLVLDDAGGSFQVGDGVGQIILSGGKLGVGISPSLSYTLNVDGDANLASGSVYRIGGTPGVTTSCSGGQFLQNLVAIGGLVTGGTCASGVVTSIGTIDSQTKSANGAVISGNTLVLQTADGSNPGLVSTGTQTFAGAKTFTGNIITNSALQVDGNTTLGDATTDTITAKGSLIANASATGTTATTSGTGTNTTTVTLSGSAFTNGDVILIDNAGQDYYTRVISGGGTASLTVSPAVTFETARTVTKYNIQNIGATDSDYTTQTNRFYQGYFLGGVVTGAGSTTLSDGLLSATGSSLNLYGGTADSASAVGLTINTPSYTTAGAKLVSFGNNSVEKFSVDKDGNVNIASGAVYKVNGTSGTSVTCSGGQFLQNLVATGGLVTGGTCTAGGSGVTTVGTFSGSSQTNGASISSSTITFGPADSTNPGMVSTGTQTIAGAKTLIGTVPAAATGSVATGAAPLSQYVSGKYAYVPSSSGNTLNIYNVSNPASPVSVGSIATAASPRGVHVQGRYAYVVNFTTSVLAIYDVSNPGSPTSVGSVSIGAGAQRVFVSGKYAYVTESSAAQLEVIDISNPASPVIAGAVATGSPIGVYVRGKYAYVTDNGGGLAIYDISDPTAITSPGSVTTAAGPQDVFVQGKYAYVANTTAGTTSIVDISNPVSPTLISSPTTTNVRSVYVQGKYMYVANGTGNTIQVLDVSNPASVTSVGTMPTNSVAKSVFVQGRYVYAVSQTGATLQVFDMGGSYIQQLEAGGLETNTISTSGDVSFGNNVDVQGGLTVGATAQFNGKVGFDDEILVNTSTNALNAQVAINAVAGKDTGLNVTGDVNSFYQINIQNTNSGASASSDFVATANNGSSTTYYVDFGINGSGGGAAPFTGANDAYLYASDSNNLHIGALGSSGAIKFYTTGGTSSPSLKLTLDSLGALTQTATSSTTTAYTLTANSLTSGNGLAIGSTATGLTGNLFSVTSGSTSAFTNGGIRYNFTGAHTGNGVQIDDVTTTGTVYKMNANSLTSGNGLVISNTGTGLTGNLFSVTSGSTSAFTNGGIRYNFTGAHTGNGVQIDDATTTGTVYQINASALTTGTAFNITGPSGANLVRVKNDSTQNFNKAQLIIGAGDANNPDALARDSLYVFGRINSSWNQLWADCLTNEGTKTAATTPTGVYGAAWSGGVTTPRLSQANTTGQSGTCRIAFATPLANATGYFGTGGLVTQRSLNPVFESAVLATSDTDTVALLGFSSLASTANITTSTNQATEEAFFRKQASNTQWEAVTRSTANSTENITTNVGSNNVTHRFRVEMDDTAAAVRFYVDGTLVATHSTNAVPATAARLSAGATYMVTGTTSRNLDIDYMRVWSDDPPASIAPEGITQSDGIDTTNQTETADSGSSPPEDNSNDALLTRIKSLEQNVDELNNYKDVLTTEDIGSSSLKKGIFIADVEFRKQVEFSADALFHADVNVDGTLNANGRVVVSNNTGTITMQPGQTEIQVLFAKPLGGKPNVFLSTENPDVKVVAQERTKDGFKIKLSQPITDPLDVQWFAVEKD